MGKNTYSSFEESGEQNEAPETVGTESGDVKSTTPVVENPPDVATDAKPEEVKAKKVKTKRVKTKKVKPDDTKTE
jgi:hypothetical protein